MIYLASGLAIIAYVMVWIVKNLGSNDADFYQNFAKLPLGMILLVQGLVVFGLILIRYGIMVVAIPRWYS